MPTIFRYAGYRFFFFSNEGSPREPIHVHVRRGESVAKFWLEPEVVLASSYRLNATELHDIEYAIMERREFIREKWNEYFAE